MTKKLLIREIVEYIDKSYKNDPRIVELVKKFKDFENKSKTKAKKKNKTKLYKISKKARDWLLPIVDAEYFKFLNYNFNEKLDEAMIEAMSCLDTEIYENLKNNIKF